MHVMKIYCKDGKVFSYTDVHIIDAEGESMILKDSNDNVIAIFNNNYWTYTESKYMAG